MGGEDTGAGSSVETFATFVVDWSRLVVVALVVLTVLIGAGVAGLGMAEGSLGSDSDERQAYDYVQSSFGTEDVHQTLLVVNDENVLDKKSLQEQLRTQEAIVSEETVARTIETEHSVHGVANAIAIAGIVEERIETAPTDESTNDERADEGPEVQSILGGSTTERTAAARDGTLPSLAEQQAQLASMSQTEIDETLSELLDGERTANTVEPVLPADFDATTLSTESTLIVITHDRSATEDQRLDAYDSIRKTANEELSNTPAVFSQDRMDQEVGQSTADSLLLVGPLVLLLALLALAITYRDLIDILLGFVGVLVVLIWMAGFMGWVGIEFHVLFVAIPLMLVGLAIDYSVHLVMRYREADADGSTHSGGRTRVRRAMTGGLVGVLGAFLWVTATTSIGFLSNLVSNITQIQEFGLVLAVGIVSTFVVFSTLIPALKVEVDEWFVGRGHSRRKPAFGTTGTTRRLLEGIGSLATARPVLVIGVVLVLSLGGAYGATHVDGDSDMQMFAPEQPPSWMENLPGPFSPGEYHAAKDLAVVEEQFARDDTQGWVLVRGNLTRSGTLGALAHGHEAEIDRNLVANVDTPLSRMERAAAENSTFNETFTDADTTGDRIPDTGLTIVYDTFYETAPAEAVDVLHRDDDGYQAIRMIVTVKPGASTATIDAETRAVADAVDSDELRVTPTGRPVAAHTAQTNSRNAAIEGVTITVVVILVLLTIGYRRRHGSWTLGGVTLLPMVLLLSWVFGTMALLDVPLNALTAVIASFTVALGVDYSIHMSERFYDELQRVGSVNEAVVRTVVGTGGALAGSALTTATAFGILVLAINPALEQFGIVMGLTVGYAFLVAVLVLPSLLVLRTRLADQNADSTNRR